MNRELEVRYGKQMVSVQSRERSSSKASVQIIVHPEGKVEALVPRYQRDSDIQTALNKRASWIFKQLRNFEEQQSHTLPRSYVGGESHLYLGRRYVLRVLEVKKNQPSSVKLRRGHLEICTHYKSKAKIRGLLNQWYREKAKIYLTQRLEVVSEQALWLKSIPDLRIRAMSKQWGNCSRNGTLTLNTHLIKAPRECIDYVIQHELCHFVEHNHSARFYRLLKKLAPKWEITKLRLDRLAPSAL